MTGPWDEAAERKRRGLPSAQEQAESGLTSEQLPVYLTMVADRKEVKREQRHQRRAMEVRGRAVVEAFAQAGISTSYEWRTGVPVVQMGLGEAERLLKAFTDLAEAYDIAAAAGRSLADYVAKDFLDTETGKEPS